MWMLTSDCGDLVMIYPGSKASCCTPETNSYVSYTSMKKQNCPSPHDAPAEGWVNRESCWQLWYKPTVADDLQERMKLFFLTKQIIEEKKGNWGRRKQGRMLNIWFCISIAPKQIHALLFVWLLHEKVKYGLNKVPSPTSGSSSQPSDM